MSKCGNCCYGVMTGPNRMFCSAQNCVCEEVIWCEDYEPIVKPTTNVDRFRAMTDEELAEKIGESIDCEVCKTMHHSESGECPSKPHQSCVDFWLDWLRQEASDG